MGESFSRAGDYYGGKWGVHLRAPDLWFELLDQYGDRFTPLGRLAEIRFGVKSGKDNFFYPRDCSRECLEEISDPVLFAHEYGVPREKVELGELKLVMAGDQHAQMHAIESEYLEPEVHSLMEIKDFIVRHEDCSRMILFAPSPREELAETFVLKYIEWGEQLGYHRGSTCAQRVTDEREWYDLTGHRRGVALWPKAQQYRHVVPANVERLQANCNLYDLFPINGVGAEALTAMLNSTIVVLSKYQFGRPVGNEGNLKTEIVDVSMMLVPSLTGATNRQLKKLEKAFENLAKRRPLQFLSERRMRRMAMGRSGRQAELVDLSDISELDMGDRRALDHAVLEILGVKTEKERTRWINDIYAHLKYFFEATRRKEEMAIGNKNTSRRRVRASPRELAAQIVDYLSDEEPRWFRSYRDFWRDSASSAESITVEVPNKGEPAFHQDMFSLGVRYTLGRRSVGFSAAPTKAHAELLVLATSETRSPAMFLPKSETAASALLREYQKFLNDRNSRVLELVADRVADDEVQAKVFEFVISKIRSGGNTSRVEQD